MIYKSKANDGIMKESRTPGFTRNDSLEDLLSFLNSLLGPAETSALDLLPDHAQEHPVIFVAGPHRSGTTLFMQWLASLGFIAYPTNLLSRFYEVPVVGANIQLLLTDPRYNFRNEIMDFNSPVTFDSENGKTRGALAPNEFWYFWRRFMPADELASLNSEELDRRADKQMLSKELRALTKVFDKPFALKSMILNYHIPFLASIFPDAIFVEIKRDPITNIASILEARKRQLGSEKEWYSFKIPEYDRLKDLDPLTQSTRQLQSIIRAVELGMSSVRKDNRIIVQYEDFCDNPGQIFAELITKLNMGSDEHQYQGVKKFERTRKTNIDRSAEIKKVLSTPFDFA